MRLVDAYKSFLKETGGDEVIARKKTVALFKSWVEESFENMTGETFPNTAIDEMVTNTELLFYEKFTRYSTR